MPLFVGDQDGWSVFGSDSSEARREPEKVEMTLDTGRGDNVDPEATSGDSGAFWEPWVPAVGQRVRIKLSAECRYGDRQRRDSAAARNGFPPGHADFEEGLTGFVLDSWFVKLINPGWPEDPAHRFMVMWDHQAELPNGETVNCSSYAASELEPIDDQP